MRPGVPDRKGGLLALLLWWPLCGQGAVERGEVKPPTELDRNPELVRAQAFLLGHERPGTLSLALSENDDDQDMRLDAGYRNVEFLITTGQAAARSVTPACGPGRPALKPLHAPVVHQGCNGAWGVFPTLAGEEAPGCLLRV